MNYDHKKIASKWAKKWQNTGLYRIDLASPGRKFYNLMMFPYPSAEGLHVGNMYAFTGADFYGRFQAMQGKTVFEPIGLDGFGIHSENYALKVKKHPADLAKVSQKHFYDQLSKLGNRFNWEQKLETYDPSYYQWTQWLFIKMFKKGLAYRKASLVNWCPSCKTVLADEQVENGVCERCKTPVERRETEQWFFKITDYADRLLEGLDKINWPEKIKTAQRNWIGKKEGVEIDHQVDDLKLTLTAFSAYPAWLFADTFLVIAPEHPLVDKLLKGTKLEKEVMGFVNKYRAMSDQERQQEQGEKVGIFTGRYTDDPFSGFKLPVWVANFALMGFGTGIIRCSAHDPRDYEFAKKYDIKLKEVVDRVNKKEPVNAHDNQGVLKDSGAFTGRKIDKNLIQDVVDWIVKQKIGRKVVTYHLRDWLISRQRYWGPPIPMINCPKCGWQPEKEENLPVVLPFVADYQPTGDGKSPLQKAPKDWLEVNCPNCGGKAKRETDVSDTFLDSAWYFLRYPSVDYKEGPLDLEITKTWLPVDAYIGGAEHAVLHLMYSRFTWMAMQDWGEIPKSLGSEPFPFLYSHGLLIKDGNKMSKSRGNVINPDEYIESFGADALRMYLMFLGPYDQGGDFRDTGMRGMGKFLNRVWRLIADHRDLTHTDQKTAVELLSKLHQTVKKVTLSMTDLRYNVAIANLMDFTNFLYDQVEKMEPLKGKMRCAEWEAVLSKLTLMLAPMAPFIAEEMWESLGGKFSIHQQLWPEFNEKLAQSDMVTIVVQVNGKVRGQFELSADEVNQKAKVLKLAYQQERVKLHLKDKKVIKEIFVPGKLVNLAVKE